MGAIAKWITPCVFASAPGDRLVLLDGDDDRLQVGLGVGAIAIRLVFAPAACAPGILASFDFHDVRSFLGYLLFHFVADFILLQH